MLSNVLWIASYVVALALIAFVLREAMDALRFAVDILTPLGGT